MNYKLKFAAFILICACCTKCSSCNSKDFTKSTGGEDPELPIGSFKIKQDLENRSRPIILFLDDTIGNPMDTLSLTPVEAALALTILNSGKTKYSKLHYLIYTNRSNSSKTSAK